MAAVCHFYSHAEYQIYEVVHVKDLRHIFYCDLFCGEQAGADDLQCFVLAPIGVMEPDSVWPPSMMNLLMESDDGIFCC